MCTGGCNAAGGCVVVCCEDVDNTSGYTNILLCVSMLLVTLVLLDVLQLW